MFGLARAFHRTDADTVIASIFSGAVAARRLGRARPFASHTIKVKGEAQRREGFLTGKKVSERKRSQSGVGVRLSHEVTVGDSHGREPVGQHSTIVFSPEGTTGNNAK